MYTWGNETPISTENKEENTIIQEFKIRLKSVAKSVFDVQRWKTNKIILKVNFVCITKIMLLQNKTKEIKKLNHNKYNKIKPPVEYFTVNHL